VQAEALVAWAADSDAGAERSAWAPHAGQVPLVFRDIVVPASRGLRHAECRRLLPYYDWSTAIAVDREPLLGAIERFDILRSAARRTVQAAIEATARVRIQPHIPGRRYRNVRVACLVERQTTERVALPAWILIYHYRGTAYRALVHGQRADRVHGRAPLDRRKLALLVGLVGLVGLAAAIAKLALG
jgi:hypothetical protein